jgi:hypothetical protein
MCFINRHAILCPPGDDATEWAACYDANNLYGEAMCSLLPCRDFEWIEPENLESIDWLNIDTEGEECYTLKVDLSFPDDIHDVTADLPLAAVNQLVTWEMLTELKREDYRSMREQRHQPVHYTPGKKLLQTCEPKHEYIANFRMIKYFLQMGMAIAKFHSFIKCKQAYVLRDYVEMNSRKRAATTNDFEKTFYKLLNNSLYG